MRFGGFEGKGKPRERVFGAHLIEGSTVLPWKISMMRLWGKKERGFVPLGDHMEYDLPVPLKTEHLTRLWLALRFFFLGFSSDSSVPFFVYTPLTTHFFFIFSWLSIYLAFLAFLFWCYVWKQLKLETNTCIFNNIRYNIII